MSIRLLNQVLDLPLRPAEKLVLSVLADLANDVGVCWPSLSYVAPRASVSTRTLQRIMCSLESQGLIRRQPRYRADGSRTSSEYLILPQYAGGDSSSPPAVIDVTPPTSSMAVGHDTYDTPLPQNEPKAKNNHNHKPSSLVYPRSFDANRTAAADRLLSRLSPTDAQALIDELVGRMNQGRVASPLSYLRALVKRHADGQFIPELADQVSKQRQRQEEQAPTQAATTRLPRERIEQHMMNMRRTIARGAIHAD